MSSTSPQLRAEVGLEPPTILVVDDEELNRELYRRLVLRAGYNVCVASDGESALEAVRRNAPDAILLDFRMPRMDGPAVLRKLRADALHADLPVILLTAESESERIAEAFDAGADDYLLKPVDTRILHARIRSTLSSREYARRIRVAAERERSQEVLRNQLLADLREARDVQRAQLPALPRRFDGAWVSGAVEPCGHVGGDLIDVTELSDGSFVATLMDVAGHGTGAALIASAIRAQLRGLLAAHDLPEAIAMLDRWLLAESAARHVCIGAIKMRGRSFTMLNAGLPAIWVGGREKPRMLVPSASPPPGLFKARKYEVTQGVLEPGEIIAVVSDGVTEPFGFIDEVDGVVPKILGAIGDGAPHSGDVASRIRALFDGAEQPDDATALLIGAAS
ncbi:MAG: fused response regulator/phosphatase [Polyangiaceae bacterium]|nr:fused response regulator/phosphatase [Polyangiaceae bacterium]